MLSGEAFALFTVLRRRFSSPTERSIALHRKKKLSELRCHLMCPLRAFWIDFGDIESAMANDRIDVTEETAVDRNFEQRLDVEDVEESVDDGSVFSKEETRIVFRMLLDVVGEAETVHQVRECEVGDVVERKRSRRARGWKSYKISDQHCQLEAQVQRS